MTQPNPYRPTETPEESPSATYPNRQRPATISGPLVVLVILVVPSLILFALFPLQAIAEFIGYLREQ
jgi:hypothetical protein